MILSVVEFSIDPTKIQGIGSKKKVGEVMSTARQWPKLFKTFSHYQSDFQTTFYG
jgi:hypothetical protein